MIHELNESEKINIEDSWEGKSGIQVEDVITRNTISSIDYDQSSEMLSLIRVDGTKLTAQVSAIKPSYIYDIIIYGIRIDKGAAHNAETLLMQYREGKKIEVGIAIKSVADRTGTLTTVNKPFDVTIKFNNSTKNVSSIYPINHKYFKTEGTGIVLDIPEGEKAEDIVVWVDITEFFKKSFSNKKIEASIKQTEDNITLTYSNTLQTSITNEVINIVYKGDTVITNNKVDILFDPSNTVSSNYKLSGFVNNDGFTNQKGNLTINNLQPGLNKICVRAIHGDNPEIYTDWLIFDVIYAESNYTDTTVAVNGVGSYITNNGVATLYKLNIYSPKNEEVEIITYLNDDEPSIPLTNLSVLKELKREIINPSAYNINTNTTEITYQKYIEVFSDNSIKYLLIKVDGEFYSFLEPSVYNGDNYLDSFYFKEMTIEAINTNYTYVNNYSTSLNFDQIVGQTNNVFVTKTYSDNPTVNELLESSDGWHDSNGRTYFKVSALPIDIFKNGGLNPQLSNNFTIELGIKTYNISNIDSNILTIGKLQLRPTSVSWLLNRDNYTDNNKYLEDLLKRISKFLEGVETHIVITLNSDWCVSDYPNFYYPDYLGEEQAVFEKGVESTSGHLIRIYINGVIDREYIITDTDVEDLKKAVVQLRTENSDIDFYLFRIYNGAALDCSLVIKNYISFLPDKNSKESFFNKNDILDEDTGLISWKLCQGKLNTLVYVFPEGGLFPHRFWGGEDGDTNNPNKKARVSLFINYANPKDNVQYGGRLNNLLVKGQGSSAMRYLIWNVGSLVKKHTEKVYDELGQPVLDEKGNQKEKAIDSIFTPQGLLHPESIPEDYTAIESLKELKNCYCMPKYTEQADPNAPTYKYKKMVGKVNYASSMQSHKIGACKLYSDAYYKSIGALRSGGLKAVHEEPFMYFYLETTLSNELVEKLSWEDLMSMSNQIKFMGFLTWGPGKGDKACSGYDEDLTPEYLMLEGGENGDESVNFLVPWHDLQRGNKEIGSDSFVYRKLGDLSLSEPLVTQSVSESNPEYNLWIDDESVVYKTNDKGSPIGAWDIDFGCEEVEKDVEAGILKGYFKFDDNVLTSLKKFRAFYDFVYMTDFTFIVEPGTVKFITDDWDKTRKHVITSNLFKYNESDSDYVPGHQAYDVYRYDIVNKRWVKAGLFFNNGDWDRLNYMNSFYGNELANKLARFNEFLVRNELKTLFENRIGEYIDTKDTAFHQAFIKYLSGTDNRAKNTYFQIIGPIYKWIDEEAGTKELNESLSDYKIRFIGDDLDTILATDNNGLLSKDYNLIEDSYNLLYNLTWGDKGNIFFRMFDLVYEEDIKKELSEIMTTAGMSASGVNETSSYFYKVFFKVQEDFPAIAYNHTAKIYYENAYAILHAPDNKGAYGSFSYTHNDVDPIGLSHGSCLECERLFMKERIGFLAGYALSNLDGIMDVSGGSGGGGSEMKLLLEFEPFLDFYPSYNAGDNTTTFHSMGDLRTVTNQPITYEALQTTALTNRLVAKQGESYTAKITDSGIHQLLMLSGMFKSLSITGLTLTSLKGNFDKAVNFEIDNTKIEENKDFFKEDWPGMAITDTITNVILPVVQTLNLKQMVLPDTLDLSTYYKLLELDITGSTTKYIIFPQTGHFTKVIMPATINLFRIYNNPGLESVEFESIDNIKTIYIDCAKCGQFNVEEFIENLSNNTLESVTLRNAELSLTEEALRNLLYAKNCIIEGTITIINSIEDRTEKDINFSTKQLLAETFGNIDDVNNSLYIIYRKSDIYKANISYNKEISIFYLPGEEGTVKRPNLFSLSVSSGNNIRIKETNGKTHLDVTYSLTGVNSSYATIDPVTGDITMHKESSNPAKVTITLNTDKSSITTETITVYFLWLAPKIGDFVYADGSYSRGYDPNKTMMGLIYAIDSTDENNGVVHLIGTEYTYNVTDKNGNYIGLYSGYNPKKANALGDTILRKAFSVKQYVEGSLKLTNYETVEGTSFEDDVTSYDTICITNYKTTSNTKFSGKKDTLAYVNHVNNILSKLEAVSNGTYSKYIVDGAIKDLDNLVNFCDDLDTNESAGNIAGCLLYPYFYSAYLYIPTVKEGESFREDLFGKGQWYMPSLPELARIIYYRGYSVSGDNFYSCDSVTNSINTNIAELNSLLKIPIFSIAKKTMSNNFPTVWDNICKLDGVNNITTSVNDADNYGYILYMSMLNNNINYYEWHRGGWDNYNDGTSLDWDLFYAYSKIQNIYRLNKHCGVPFVQFKYSKNDGLSSVRI